MNALEANLLDRSVGRLSDTLITNRQMDQRAKEAAVRSALESDALDVRREDNADARDNRRLSLEAQKAHQARLETIGKEANASKRNQQYLEFLAELNKSGQLTDDGLSRMEDAFNDQFGAAGLGVKLFRTAPQKTPTAYKSPSGTDYTVFGNTMQRDFDPRVTVTEETDEMGNPKRKIQRRVNPADLDKEMATVRDPAAGPTRDQQSEMDEILSRPGIPAGGPANTAPLASPVRPGATPTVASQADFDKLPRGSKYINAKDGKTYTKP